MRITLGACAVAWGAIRALVMRAQCHLEARRGSCNAPGFMQIPAHRGQSFRRIADSVPVIADSF
jgi:hypothetical protein